MAWGNHMGQIFISNYDINANEEEPDLRTIQGRLQAKRSKLSTRDEPNLSLLCADAEMRQSKDSSSAQ